MSTPAEISYFDSKQNKYYTIYTHWDGAPYSMGEVLLKHYINLEKIKRLVSLGDCSIVSEKIDPDPSQAHTFDKHQDGVCVFYNRDRGEELEIRVSLEVPRKNQLYLYLFTDDTWYCNDGSGLKLLTPNFMYSAKIKKSINPESWPSFLESKKELVKFLKDREEEKKKLEYVLQLAS